MTEVQSIFELCKHDVVIDTNVLSHASNTTHPYHQSALEIIKWLQSSSSVLWVLDDQGKMAPKIETSLLASEYFATLPPQSLPLTVLARYLSFGRVSFAKRPSQADQKKLQKIVPRNKCDRAVLGAAVGSQDKVLLSNDEKDFHASAREESNKCWSVSVLLSSEAVPVVAA